jgi:multisubunit Na+/H+ antiporter MnhF subunit
MVEMVGICYVLRVVMLESSKDRILGVDNIG